MTETMLIERRQCPRTRASGAIWWKCRQDEPFHAGWLLEKSACGAAFLTRGRTAPMPGLRISLLPADEPDDRRVQQGHVRRVTHVHDDVYLVATELKAA